MSLNRYNRLSKSDMTNNIKGRGLQPTGTTEHELVKQLMEDDITKLAAEKGISETGVSDIDHNILSG